MRTTKMRMMSAVKRWLVMTCTPVCLVSLTGCPDVELEPDQSKDTNTLVTPEETGNGPEDSETLFTFEETGTDPEAPDDIELSSVLY